MEVAESNEQLVLLIEAAYQRVVKETGRGGNWSEKSRKAFEYGYLHGNQSQRDTIARYCVEHGQDDQAVAAVILGHYSGYCAVMHSEPVWDDVTRAIPAWQSINFIR